MDQTEAPTKKVPPWKQLAGAGAGALIALAFYGVYEVASPTLGAYLTIPTFIGKHSAADVRVQDPSNMETQERLARRAREIAEQFSERPITDMEKALEEPSAPAPVEVPVAAPVQEPPVEEAPKEEVAPAPLAATENPLYEKAEAAGSITPPTLPSSGVGLWLSIHVAFLVVLAIRYRNKILSRMRYS